jgi:hypothetical protein
MMGTFPPAEWIGQRVTVTRNLRRSGRFDLCSVTGTLTEVDLEVNCVVLRDMLDGSSGPVALDCPPYITDARVTLASVQSGRDCEFCGGKPARYGCTHNP